MKKTLFLILAFLLTLNTFAQDFFETGYNRRKSYVLLCDPTVSRIQTIHYLTQSGIFQTKKNIEFVGVYFEDQNYDFAETRRFIVENGLTRFHLEEIKGDVSVDDLFQNNQLSEQFRKVFERSVGVIFFGGPDIPPAVYGEENTRSDVTDPQRHFFETSFMFHLLGGSQNENFKPLLADRPDYLVTGFCLGMQTMNVATGGTMVQDIPAEIYHAETPEQILNIGRENLHRNYWQQMSDDSLLMGNNLHTLRFTDHPFFGQAVKVKKKATPRVLSWHHQAADKIGKGLAVTALSPDGKVVEGLAHNLYPNVYAVQFHPEVPALYEKMYALKFHPDDVPKSFFETIGKPSVKFHKAYWEHLSKSLAGVRKLRLRD